jgi:hypothetical protein
MYLTTRIKKTTKAIAKFLTVNRSKVVGFDSSGIQIEEFSALKAVANDGVIIITDGDGDAFAIVSDAGGADGTLTIVTDARVSEGVFDEDVIGLGEEAYLSLCPPVASMTVMVNIAIAKASDSNFTFIWDLNLFFIASLQLTLILRKGNNN